MTTIQVPVKANFGDRDPIGWLTIEKEYLPPSPNYVFALGYWAHGINTPGVVPDKPYLGSYDLREVSIVSDNAYAEYLKQIGKA